MQTTTHSGCVDDAVRQSALKVDTGKKSLAEPGTQTQVSIVSWLFSWTFYQLNYSCPRAGDMVFRICATCRK